jgi:hypothetical protein
MSKVEEPPFEATASDNPFEVRSYHPMIVAETEPRGPQPAAIREEFRRIAAYILGDNSPQQKNRDDGSSAAKA